MADAGGHLSTRVNQVRFCLNAALKWIVTAINAIGSSTPEFSAHPQFHYFLLHGFSSLLGHTWLEDTCAKATPIER